MKKISKSTFWFCVTVVLFVGAVHSASVAQTADIDQNKDSGRQLILHDGSPVLLAFAEGLSSKDAAMGEKIKFVVVNDIKVGDVTAVKAGCTAFGEVTYVRRAAAPGKPGALNLKLDYIQVGQTKVLLRTAEGGNAGELQYRQPTRLKWPMGLFRTGDDVEIRQGTVLAVFVAGNTSFRAEN